VAEDIKEAQQELQRLADAMVKYTRDNSLAFNGAKTQMMIGSTKAKARDKASISIILDGAVRPYLCNLAREARFRAGRVARMSQHLPRGQLLWQLGSGLLMGKLAHCLPVVARP
jgi:hypothetical protein